MASHQVPGAQVAVIDEGAVIWTRSYGLANREAAKPVTDRTLFNVGSVSKVVTAWGVMAMVEENTEIDLDDPAQRHLRRWRIPESTFEVEAVTVRRLLSHTSGLSVFPASESFTYPSSLEETLSQSYGAFGRLRLVREPGTEFEYNNGNYLVLQLLIEEVTGVSFAAYMQRAVLGPLKMESSAYAAVERDRIAVPYDQRGRPLPLYPTYHNENFAASGGLYTTAGDLATFVAAAMPGPGNVPPGRGVLGSDTVGMMISPAGETHGNYGLGYKMLPVSSTLTMIGHDGANPGWKATFLAAPEKGVGIVILTNSSAGSKIVGEIVCTWADWEPDIELSGLCQGDKPIPRR